MEKNITPGIEENGNVNISDEVISVIASLAASEVKGIAGMSGGFGVGIAELLGKKNLSKGVKLTVTEKEVVLDLSVVAEYGAKIPAVAWELQKKVKSEVEAMTGLVVTAVNISVDGVNVPKIDNEKESANVAGEEPEEEVEIVETEETTED